MAIAPRAPGDYAPAAGGRAVEALQDAAEPLRGARILHVSAAGAEGRVPEFLGGLLPLAAGAGVEIEWRVLFGSAELRATSAALMSGLRGGESAIEDGAWEEYLDACDRTAASLQDGYDAIVLHDAALGLARGPRGAAAAARRAVAPPRGRLARGARRARARGRACRALRRGARVGRRRSPRRRFRTSALQVAAPGIDPLDPRNLELESAPAGPGGASARRGPRAALLPPGAGARPLGRPARRHRRLPRGQGRGARAPARAGRAARPRGHRELAGRQGDLRLRRGHRRRAAAHHLRGPRQPRGRRAPAARAHGDRALAPRGLRARPVRGALEAHPGGGRDSAAR